MTAAARILRSPALLAMAAIGLLLVLAGTISVVPETKQAVILRLGAPLRVVNGYRPDEVFGQTGAGLKQRARRVTLHDLRRIQATAEAGVGLLGFGLRTLVRHIATDLGRWRRCRRRHVRGHRDGFQG